MSSRIAARGLYCALFSLVLGGFPSFAQFVPNRYTLLLEDAPVSSRFVSREAMRTSPAIAYRQQIEAKQRKVLGELASRNIPVTGSDATLVNAIFVIAAASRLDELKSIPGVAAVRPMRRFKPSLNRATQLMNAPLAWNALGGAANAGKGIKIGILDSGIDQTHPAFQDSTLTVPPGFPICSGSADACNYTNNKVIVARSYVRQLAGFTSKDPVNLPDDTSVPPSPSYSTPDDYSPRDHLGHGTATASAAAANTNTGTVTFTGMAPKAYLGNYKFAGSPGVNDGPTDDVFILAVRDALQDGMDVVSLSWGAPALTGALDTGAVCGNPAGQPCDPVAAAFEAAAQAGLVIAVAAGNFGEDAYNYYNGNYPYFDSISSPATAPSVIGVGATINSHVLTPGVSVNAANAPANLKRIAAQPSDAIFYPSSNGANQAPLIDVTQLGDNGLACTALPANSLNGAYALIERGGGSACAFAVKASNAQLAGATGIVFYMADSSATVIPTVGQFTGPVVMISNSDGLALKSYIDANPGQVVTIDTAGTETDLATYVGRWGLPPRPPTNSPVTPRLARLRMVPSNPTCWPSADLTATSRIRPGFIWRLRTTIQTAFSTVRTVMLRRMARASRRPLWRARRHWSSRPIPATRPGRSSRRWRITPRRTLRPTTSAKLWTSWGWGREAGCWPPRPMPPSPPSRLRFPSGS